MDKTIEEIKDIIGKDLLEVPYHQLDKPSYISTPNGVFIFTGKEFEKLSDPKGNDASKVEFQKIKPPVDSAAKIIHDFVLKNETGEDLDLSGFEPEVGVTRDGAIRVTGMTIKDVARHKDVVKLEKQLENLRNDNAKLSAQLELLQREIGNVRDRQKEAIGKAKGHVKLADRIRKLESRFSDSDETIVWSKGDK